MLLALCHHCWTWIEPKHERCVECGSRLDLPDPDPSPEEIQQLLGDALLVLGEVSLHRPRIPSFGVLSAYAGGLLFLPDVRDLPTGGVMAIEQPRSSLLGGSRGGFWSLLTRQLQPHATSTISVVRPLLKADEAASRLLDTPGAVLLRQSSLGQIVHRGTLLRIPRKPGRTVNFRVESPVAPFRQQLEQLGQTPSWKTALAHLLK